MKGRAEGQSHLPCLDLCAMSDPKVSMEVEHMHPKVVIRSEDLVAINKACGEGTCAQLCTYFSFHFFWKVPHYFKKTEKLLF